MNRIFSTVLLALMAIAGFEISRPVGAGRGCGQTKSTNQRKVIMSVQSRQVNLEKLSLAIDELESHRKELGLSVSQFVTRYPNLGSAKTYQDRLVAKKFEEFGKKLPLWERKVASVLAQIRGHSPVSEYFDDMPLARHLDAVYGQLQAQTTDRRCAICLATTGAGKSVWGRRVVEQHPGQATFVRAAETWKNSLSQVISGIGSAAGFNTFHYSSTGRKFDALIHWLEFHPFTIIIDEAHLGGVQLLKVVKDLIDATPAKFVLLAYPYSFRRIMSESPDAQSESQQLLGRTIKPIYDHCRNGIDREAITVYLKNAAGFDDPGELAAKILPVVRANGNLRVLCDAVEEARIQSEATEEPLTEELIIARLNRLCPMGGKELRS
jgi:hypothetical protein